LKIKNIPFGRYQFFAVGNCDKVNETSASTVDNLKKITMKWDETNPAVNNALYGYFNYESEKDEDFDRPFGFGGQTVVVNRNTGVYHAWLRRLASKVTIGFDPTGLKPDVVIYINSVTIRDIPATCKLGMDNTPESKDLIAEGQTIYYGTNGPQEKPGATYKEWMPMGRGSGVLDQWHEDNSPSLYFFENMQGDYSNDINKQKYDKRMNKNAVGINISKPGQPDYKDEVVNGTYIEVQAYYASTNQENTTSGPIVYRFMLGQDVKYNYNSQRNHHYKVTLGFNGWANQPDWHINYEEEDPDVEAPDEFRVSYLYNAMSKLPVKVNGNCVKLEARIIQNNWYPCDSTNKVDSLPAATVGDFKWYKSMASTYNGQKYPYLGFLALKVKEEADGSVATNIIDMQFSDKEKAQTELKKYYENNGQNFREYNVTPGTYGNPYDPEKTNYNSYEVKNLAATDPAKHQPCPANGSASRQFLIPLITRNKTMITASGYTGNNPYENYDRKAVVRITAYFDINGKIIKRIKDVTVFQVRRLVNPKAVWRPAANSDNFRVDLYYAKKPTDTEYTNVKSEGEWKAYVRTSNVADPSTFIKLKDVNGKTYMSGDTICGYTLSNVQFEIEFVGANTEDTPRCAVINVMYHGNQCEHKILVRQGFKEPLEIVAGKKPWSSYSLYSCSQGNVGDTGKTLNAEATMNPLTLGTYFKYGNYQQGIKVSNNDIKGPLASTSGYSFELTNGKNATWSSISRGTYQTNNVGRAWCKFLVKRNGKEYTYRVPTYDDFKSLDEADFAYGIAYGEGADKTEKNIIKSQSYADPDNDNNKNKGSSNGMRCIIAYRKSDAHQVMFPLGARGMGRRTEFNIQLTPKEDYYGMLRYGDVSNVLNGANDKYRPIPYNLPACPGAIYWINAWQSTGHVEAGVNYPCFGWDMNYFNFDFGPYTQNNRYDACPIKLVCESVKNASASRRKSSNRKR
ncbi:MAG: hypothetical protein K2N03_04450, partial [Muribaculaceae bacterium]|nr:hypothetical protein [Muribaculaceae bacterium]